MAHLRKRFLTPLIRKSLAFSPIVGVLGHRQVGKTTLLTQISEQYTTFDDIDVLKKAHENPKKFIGNFKKTGNAIDECQLEPLIFPTLKERVRLNKQPGQFLLSGSVRFTSKKAIQESLTGRIVNTELLPFTISEIKHKELPKTCHIILESSNLEQSVHRLEQEIQIRRSLELEIDTYLERGGLPGVCFIRDNKIRKERIAEQLQTILDRDLRKVFPTNLTYSVIFSFIQILAQLQGQPLNFSYIKRKTGISAPTQKKLLFAMEAVFLIRLIRIQGGKQGDIAFLEDQGESRYLHPNQSKLDSFESLIYRNIRAEFFYQIGEHFQITHYLTRNKARVPIVISTDLGVLGVIPISEDTPSLSVMRSAASFLKKYLNSKIIIVTRGKKIIALDERTLIIPSFMIV